MAKQSKSLNTPLVVAAASNLPYTEASADENGTQTIPKKKPPKQEPNRIGSKELSPSIPGASNACLDRL